MLVQTWSVGALRRAVGFSWRTVKTERQLEVSRRGHLHGHLGARASANPGAPMPRWADRRCLFTFVVGTPHFVGGVNLQVQAQERRDEHGGPRFLRLPPHESEPRVFSRFGLRHHLDARDTGGNYGRVLGFVNRFGS